MHLVERDTADRVVRGGRIACGTRARILDSAKVEFGAKGFAGARVSDIADRAGVNKQLISYCLSGRKGLFAEQSAQWRQANATLASRSTR